MNRMLSKNSMLLFFLLGLWLALSLMTQLWLIPKKMPHDYDLFPRWYGAREMLRGENPYTDKIAFSILESMGYPPTVDKYVHRFYYPATVTWILLPFWIIPFSWSIILWCGLQLLLVLLLPLRVFSLLRWRIPPLLLALVTVFSIIPWRHSANAYVLGQFPIFILMCLVLSWWMIIEERLWVAAIFLVGSTFRTEAIVLTTALLLYLVLTRHAMVVAVWTAVMGTLFILSMIPIGFWIPDFLRDMKGYGANQEETFVLAIVGMDGIAYLLIGLIISWGCYMLFQMRSLPERYRFPWVLAVLILLSLLVLPQTKDYTLVYALFPIWLIIWAGRDQKWNAPLMLLFLTAPWIYNALGANMGHESQLEQFLTPALLSGLLTVRWFHWKQTHMPHDQEAQLSATLQSV